MLILRISVLSCLVLVLSLENAVAQTGRFEVSGVVMDSTEVGLSGATVMVMEPDSTLISFGITRQDGIFRLGRVPAGNLLLQVTFVGYEPHTQPLSISNQSLDVGRIMLTESAASLEELMVTADHIPVLVRRDTLDYNAAAFRLPPNANVEELLRRLPGMEVDADGTIRAQGEVVRRILVDGREFFGSDPTIATRNLQADAVERVQVYDRRSDAAELTGIDDGRSERTVNLQLREDRRRGAFGNLSGALGDPGRYETRGNVNRFSPGLQTSVILNVNNINRQSFNFQDYSSFVGGHQNLAFTSGRFASQLPLGDGTSDGFSTTASGGLNVNYDFSPKTTIRTSYIAHFVDRSVDQISLQQELAGVQAGAFIATQSDEQSRRLNHRLEVNANHEFGEGHTLRLRSEGSLHDQRQETLDFTQNERPQGTPVNTVDRRYDWTSSTLRNNTTLTYSRRLAPGRTVVAEARSGIDTNAFDTNLEATSRFLQAGDAAGTEELNQLQDQQRRAFENSVRLNYSEPLGRRQLVEFGVQRRTVAERRDFETFDVVDGVPTLNQAQSSDFDRLYSYNTADVSFRRSVDPLTLSLGVGLQQANLRGTTGGADVDRTFVRVLPGGNARYQFSPTANAELWVNTYTREPSMRDLQPFVEVTSPLNTYVGNPDLVPEYHYNVHLRMLSFDQFSSTNIFGNVTFNYVRNSIVTSRSIDENLRRTSTVVNADAAWTAHAWLSYSRPIRPLGVNVLVAGGPTFSRGVEFINSEENRSGILRANLNLSAQTRTQENIIARGGATFTFNNVSYNLNPDLNRAYVNRTFFGEATYQFLPGWRAMLGVDYQLYSREVFGDARAVPLLRSHVAWTVPRSRAEVRLEAHDLLNRNLGVSYTNSESYIRERRTESLGRFLMLRMQYNLGASGRQTRVVRQGP